jgi:hypothetical protein
VRRSSKKAYAGPVVVLPKSLLTSDQWRALSGSEVKLLMAVLAQFNGPGRNNGGLQIIMRGPRRYGFMSNDTLKNARDGLLRAGFLQMTRIGNARRSDLYALTWVGIDRVAGIEAKADPKPADLWRTANAAMREVPIRHRRRGTLSSPKTGTRTPNYAPKTGTRTTPRVPKTGILGTNNQEVGATAGVPKTGDDSCIAMGGVPKSAGESASNVVPIPRPKPANEFEAAEQRYEKRAARRQQRYANLAAQAAPSPQGANQ